MSLHKQPEKSDDSSEVICKDFPDWKDLFRGAMRETIANALSIAKIGREETHSWENGLMYVLDDGTGNMALIEFYSNGVVGALASSKAARESAVDEALISVTSAETRDKIQSLCKMPLLEQRVSAVFWSEGNLLSGPEAWDEILHFGGEMLEHQLMTDIEWKDVGATYFDLNSCEVEFVVELATRASIAVPALLLTEQELHLLLPRDIEYRNQVAEMLLSKTIVAKIPQDPAEDPPKIPNGVSKDPKIPNGVC